MKISRMLVTGTANYMRVIALKSEDKFSLYRTSSVVSSDHFGILIGAKLAVLKYSTI